MRGGTRRRAAAASRGAAGPALKTRAASRCCPPRRPARQAPAAARTGDAVDEAGRHAGRRKALHHQQARHGALRGRGRARARASGTGQHARPLRTPAHPAASDAAHSWWPTCVGGFSTRELPAMRAGAILLRATQKQGGRGGGARAGRQAASAGHANRAAALPAVQPRQGSAASEGRSGCPPDRQVDGVVEGRDGQHHAQRHLSGGKEREGAAEGN